MSADFQLFTTIRYDESLRTLHQDGAASPHGYNHKHASPLYMLDFHRDRLLQAAQHFKWHPAIKKLSQENILDDLTRQVSDFVGSDSTGPRRVKILVSQAGEITLEKGPAQATSLRNLFPARLPEPGTLPKEDEPERSPMYTLLVDSHKTKPSEFTHYKTTRRPMYDTARQRASIALTDLKEVLVVNERDGAVMEGTIFTPYFWRGGRWATPPVSQLYDPREGSGGQNGTSRRWSLLSGIAHEETVLASSLVDGEECWLSNGLRGFVPATLFLNHD